MLQIDVSYTQVTISNNVSIDIQSSVSQQITNILSYQCILSTSSANPQKIFTFQNHRVEVTRQAIELTHGISVFQQIHHIYVHNIYIQTVSDMKYLHNKQDLSYVLFQNILNMSPSLSI